MILFVEATASSLENRHIELSMQYPANLKADPQSFLTTVYLILYMKMLIINNQMQLNLLNFESHIELRMVNQYSLIQMSLM